MKINLTNWLQVGVLTAGLSVAAVGYTAQDDLAMSHESQATEAAATTTTKPATTKHHKNNHKKKSHKKSTASTTEKNDASDIAPKADEPKSDY
jgi:hypothetical protein